MLHDVVSKGVFGTLIAFFSLFYGFINEMIIVLAILMVFDYITGALVAKMYGKFDSSKGYWGAIKKLSYLMVVITGYLSDITINSFACMIGLDFQTYGALGFAVIFYLIGNEGISLFTNWTKLGLPVPKFLVDIFIKFQSLSNSMVNNQLTEVKKDEHTEKNKDQDK